ncbi:long-chain-fatty-acid--CoA ligase [Pseudogemmobacter sonorensis]|uniref:long-chain-fatty-acid--CoA ligase n=1 Tax=Pseudogemmobacter sonorensis TaxID=2989681 RepID=UPI003693C080
MMDRPLLISSLIEQAARFHGNVEIVYREVDDSLCRYTYRDAHRRMKKLANALVRRGIRPGDRVATLAWNTHRHLELYYGISGIGAVLHTVNPRLFREQIRFIINHAENRVLFFDLSFLEMIEDLASELTTIETFVALAPRAALPDSALPLVSYEDFIAPESDAFDWPEFDERTASSLCYTSGTTGDPRGALYSHRSTILHTLSACAVDGHGVSGGECILPVVPMFHGNAWGIPYSAISSGAKLVLPGRHLDGATLYDLIEAEKVTLALGVPTVWQGLLLHMEPRGLKLSSLRKLLIGGSAVPQAMVEAFRDGYGVRIVQAWGMTEMSPMGAVAAPKHHHWQAGQAALDAVNQSQGRPPSLVDARITDEACRELPHDGIARGDLYVRGPWVIGEYYRDPKSTADNITTDGWLKTGDVCTIDPDGFIRVVDRSKDMIKSGGEWISSIDLENIAASHPAVAEAAVIAVAHPKWDERPLLVVVPRSGAHVARAELLRHFEGRVAKWWYPDDVLVVDSIPHTATGKISKAELRKSLRDYRLPTA